MLTPFSRVRWVWCVLILLAPATLASDWPRAEVELSGKIAALTGPGVVALDVVNHSSIASADVEEIRRGITAALAASNVRVWQPDQAGIKIQVTLSENLQNYVWVAVVQKAAEEVTVAMISTPRPEGVLAAQNAPAMTLHATPLLSRADPILDVALIEGNPRRMLVLGPFLVAEYEWNNSAWAMAQVTPVSSLHAFPRDVRGRIIPAKDHLFDAYLPGLVCRSTAAMPLSMNCAHSDDPWPLQTEEFGLSGFFSPARNFFTGAIVPGIGKQKSAPPFYSAAAIPRTNYTLWVLGGVDDEVHVLDGINQLTLPKTRWGSDVAGIRAGCRAGWQVLATSADTESGDSLEVFDFPDREPVALSQKLSVNGNVTALWTARDGNSAIAIYRNSETGNYEALQLTLTCGQ